MSQQPSPGQLLPAQKYLTTDKTLLCSNSTCHSHTHPLMAAFVFPPLCPWMVACQTKFQMGSDLFSLFEVGKASTHFDHMSTITRQCFCFPQGVNSMKSIIRYSNGPAGAGWDAKGVFIPLAKLCVFTSDTSFAKMFSNHCKPLCKP